MGRDKKGRTGTRGVVRADRVVTALHDIVKTVSTIPRLDDVVERMVNDITDQLGFDFAAIQLVDQERREIRTVSIKGARPMPSEFEMWSLWAHSIEDSPDIQADIVRSKRWERIYEWDKRFDREIWDKCHHEGLVRIFGPILSVPDGTAIGTVEAGYEKEHKSKITNEQARKLKAYVEQAATDIVRTNLTHLLWEIANIGVRELGIDLIIIYRYEVNKGEFVLPEIRAGSMRHPEHTHHEIRADDVAARVVRDGKSFYFPNAEEEKFLGEREDRFAKREGIKSSAGLLLRVGDNTVGVLFANYRTPREFKEAEREILETFASHAAITIENAVLYRRACVDLDRTIAKLTALREVDKTITATVDESEVLSLILQSGLRLIGARQGCGYVLLRDKDGEGNLRLAASLGIPADEFNRRLGAGKTIVHWVEETGEPTLCPGPGSTKDCQLVAANARSGVAIPFQKGGKLMGVLGIESPNQQRFGIGDVDLLEAFSGQAVIAIENAKAYRALEEAKQNQLLIVLGGVAAGMVERMRNTVSTIPWHVDAIREKVSAPRGQKKTLREYLGLIEAAAEEASSEVEEVHNLIQSRSVRTDKVAVGVLLKKAVANIRRRAPRERSGVALSLELDEPALYVQGDEVLVRKALERLIINGVQAIEGEGSVRIQWRAERSGRNARIDVSDTGRGISPELLPDRLFELGISARPGGLGIGLWFCRRIIEEHKGTIQVKSKLGKGSTFIVRLPLSSPRRVTGGGKRGHHGR